MVDNVGPSQTTPIQPTDNAGTNIGQTGQTEQTGVSQGAAANTGVTFEHSDDQYHFNVSGTSHTIDVPSDEMMDAVVGEVFTNLDDPDWQGTDFSFGMLMRAIAEAAENSNELQEFMNSVHTGDIEKMIDAFDKLAVEKKDMAINQAIIQGVGAGLQGIGGATGMASPNNANAASALGNSGQGLTSGIGGAFTAGDQEAVTLAEKDQQLSSEYMNRSGGLRDKFGSAYDKEQQAFNQVKQDEGSWYNQQAQALKG
ncbi:MAG: hypothetical protein AAGC81_07460 [Pseudomonadota bacterium]